MANLKRHFVVGVPLVRLAAHGRPKKKLWKQWKSVLKQHAKNTQKKQKKKREENGQKNGFQKT